MRFLAGGLLIAVLAGCNTVSVPLTVERPARFPLTHFKYLTLEPFEGRAERNQDIEDAICHACRRTEIGKKGRPIALAWGHLHLEPEREADARRFETGGGREYSA